MKGKRSLFELNVKLCGSIFLCVMRVPLMDLIATHGWGLNTLFFIFVFDALAFAVTFVKLLITATLSCSFDAAHSDIPVPKITTFPASAHAPFFTVLLLI